MMLRSAKKGRRQASGTHFGINLPDSSIWRRGPDEQPPVPTEPPSSALMITTPTLNEVEPQAWLADVLQRINDHPVSRISGLLLWNWTTCICQTGCMIQRVHLYRSCPHSSN